MAWIELHQAVWTHHKTLALASALDLDEQYAASHVIRLWTWALDNAQDGRLCLPARAIAYGAGWRGEPAVLVDAMVSAGWLDRDTEGTLWLHDWMDYAGRLIERRRQDAARKRALFPKEVRRNSTGVPSEMTRTSGVPYPTVPNPTGPNRTQPEGASADAEPRDAAAPAPATSDPAQSGDFSDGGAALSARAPAAASEKRTCTPRDLGPLVDAFVACGVAAPKLTSSEARAALELRGLHADGDLAECWADFASGRRGDAYDREHLSFAYLARGNRVGNWLAWRDAGKPEVRLRERGNGVTRSDGPAADELAAFGKYG